MVWQALLFVPAHGDPHRQQHIRLRLGAVCNRDFGGNQVPSMNETLRPGSATSSMNRRKARSVVKSFVSNIWIVPAVAVFVAVFLLIVEHAHISEAGGKFLASLTYSTLIGLPTAFLLNWVGFRCSERIPRLIILVYIAVLFCTATVGCFAGAGFLRVIAIVPPGHYWREIRTS